MKNTGFYKYSAKVSRFIKRIHCDFEREREPTNNQTDTRINGLGGGGWERGCLEGLRVCAGGGRGREGGEGVERGEREGWWWGGEGGGGEGDGVGDGRKRRRKGELITHDIHPSR